MDKYAIYYYKCKDAPVEGNFLHGITVVNPDTSEEHCREMIYALFGEKNAELIFKKMKKNSADTYPGIVMARAEGLVLLRVENPKEVTVWEKHTPSPGKAANIDKRKVPSNPYSFIVIDCRMGRNMIAIQVDSSVWRNTDLVADLIQENVNRKLEADGRGFAIEVNPQVLHIDFVTLSRRLIKKDRLPVTKMTVYLTRGLINPKVEDIVKNDPYLKDMHKRMFEASSAECSYNYPNGMRILDGRSKMLEHFVMLIGSEPSGAFRLRLSYADGSSYICGKDVRMEFQMSDDAFLGMLGIGNLFPEHEMGAWLDHVANEIEKQRNATTTH